MNTENNINLETKKQTLPLILAFADDIILIFNNVDNKSC